uniref:Uncharacterized protein n=1 Tax=Arundo donax TaxID=35708 RepID=A0A0A9HLQ6_ARUDO
MSSLHRRATLPSHARRRCPRPAPPCAAAASCVATPLARSRLRAALTQCMSRAADGAAPCWESAGRKGRAARDGEEGRWAAPRGGS